MSQETVTAASKEESLEDKELKLAFDLSLDRTIFLTLREKRIRIRCWVSHREIEKFELVCFYCAANLVWSHTKLNPIFIRCKAYSPSNQGKPHRAGYLEQFREAHIEKIGGSIGFGKSSPGFPTKLITPFTLSWDPLKALLVLNEIEEDVTFNVQRIREFTGEEKDRAGKVANDFRRSLLHPDLQHLLRISDLTYTENGRTS